MLTLYPVLICCKAASRGAPTLWFPMVPHSSGSNQGGLGVEGWGTELCPEPG